MEVLTYEIYHNIQHIQFKLDEQYSYHFAEAIHESVVIFYHKAIGIDCAFKNNSLSPFLTSTVKKIGLSVVYIPRHLKML